MQAFTNFKEILHSDLAIFFPTRGWGRKLKNLFLVNPHTSYTILQKNTRIQRYILESEFLNNSFLLQECRRLNSSKLFLTKTGRAVEGDLLRLSTSAIV